MLVLAPPLEHQPKLRNCIKVNIYIFLHFAKTWGNLFVKFFPFRNKKRTMAA